MEHGACSPLQKSCICCSNVAELNMWWRTENHCYQVPCLPLILRLFYLRSENKAARGGGDEQSCFLDRRGLWVFFLTVFKIAVKFVDKCPTPDTLATWIQIITTSGNSHQEALCLFNEVNKNVPLPVPVGSPPWSIKPFIFRWNRVLS